MVFVLDGVLHTGLFSNPKREGGGGGRGLDGWLGFFLDGQVGLSFGFSRRVAMAGFLWVGGYGGFFMNL